MAVGAGGTGGMTVNTGGVTINGNLYVYGQVLASNTQIGSAPSDRRLKRKLQPIEGALEKVSQLNGVYFYWNHNVDVAKKFDENRHVGLIAQEVAKVLPEVVLTDGDYLALDYASIIPLLIESINELRTQLEALEMSFGHRFSVLEVDRVKLWQAMSPKYDRRE